MDSDGNPSMDGTVLIALTELKVLVSNLASRLEESIAKNDARTDDHSSRIRQLEAQQAVQKSKVEALEREISESTSKRLTLSGAAVTVAAIAASLAFIMQVGSKMGW